MHASILRDFLVGAIAADVLAADMVDVWAWTGVDVRHLRMVDLNEDFEVEPAHLVKLCDAVIAEQIQPEVLEAIGFGMIASDHFLWDGDSAAGKGVAETLYDWSSPEINFPLTLESIGKFRHRLLTGEDLLSRPHRYRVRPGRQFWDNTEPGAC